MNTASSIPPASRPSKDAILRALEQRGTKEVRLASGVFPSFDEFAGIERLDREELDETEETEQG